jgi:hypothetical protein
MTNNKQQTLIEQFLIECGKYGDTAQIPDEVIEKYIKREIHAICEFATEYAAYELQQSKPGIKGAMVSMCAWTFFKSRRQQ